MRTLQALQGHAFDGAGRRHHADHQQDEDVRRPHHQAVEESQGSHPDDPPGDCPIDREAAHLEAEVTDAAKEDRER